MCINYVIMFAVWISECKIYELLDIVLSFFDSNSRRRNVLLFAGTSGFRGSSLKNIYKVEVKKSNLKHATKTKQQQKHYKQQHNKQQQPLQKQQQQ